MKHKNPHKELKWRIAFRLDDWAHKAGMCMFSSEGTSMLHWPWYWKLTPFPFICKVLERHYMEEE